MTYNVGGDHNKILETDLRAVGLPPIRVRSLRGMMVPACVSILSYVVARYLPRRRSSQLRRPTDRVELQAWRVCCPLGFLVAQIPNQGSNSGSLGFRNYHLTDKKCLYSQNQRFRQMTDRLTTS